MKLGKRDLLYGSRLERPRPGSAGTRRTSRRTPPSSAPSRTPSVATASGPQLHGSMGSTGLRPMPPHYYRDFAHGPGVGLGLLPRLPPPTCSRPVSGVGLGPVVMRLPCCGLPAPTRHQLNGSFSQSDFFSSERCESVQAERRALRASCIMTHFGCSHGQNTSTSFIDPAPHSSAQIIVLQSPWRPTRDPAHSELSANLAVTSSPTSHLS
jgi:hypothetical protein